MGLFSGTKDWNVVAILYEKKGHLQVNGNRVKGADAEKVRDAVKRHSRSVFWAVFNQKRSFIEGGPGAGREFVRSRRCSTSKSRSPRPKAWPRF